MNAKELLKHFKSASWDNEKELKAFLYLLPEEVEAKTVTGMLDMLCSKRLSQDTYAHGMRINVFRELASRCDDKTLFLQYIKCLKIDDIRLRSTIAPLISQVNNYEEHPKLCGLLRSPSPETRRIVADVLRQVGGKTVLHSLITLVQEKDFPGRNEAMEVALPMAGHHSIDLLSNVLESGTIPEKITALKFLGDSKYMHKSPKAALKAIAAGLEDKSDKVVIQAITSFAQLATEDAYFEFIEPFFESSNVDILHSAVIGLGNYSSPRCIAVLERKLRAGPGAIRMAVLSVFQRIGTDDVLPPLVEALGHRHVKVRNAAGEVLTELSAANKVDVARVIIWLLYSKNVEVRRMAVELAQKVKDPAGELWPKLLGFLRDEDWWVRERVMDALVELAGKQLTPHMVAYLQDPHDVVRRFAVDVLIRVADPNALGALVNAARDDKDWWTREKAIEGMAALKDQRAVPYIIDIMRRSSEVQFSCIEALKALEATSATPYVAESLSSEDVDVRYAAVKCLEAFHATDFAPALQPLLADADNHVARAAKELLLHWNIELSEEHLASKDKAVSFLDKMLLAVVEADADDLIIASGRRPYMKRMGQTLPISNTELTHEQIRALITPHLSLDQIEALEALEDVDFSYEVKSEEARFRVNVFRLHGGLGAVFRCIGDTLPDLEQLGLPPIIRTFGDLNYGLVLVGGPTGSGKSTTLAALIDYINRTSDRHVISLEDPIEVIHQSKKGVVNQREVGTHTHSFKNALRSTLREDPDVILVGEMRDLDTISFAVTASETGHLVFGTVHTVSADKSVDRLINTFPASEQPQVRTTLAENLRAVACQYLIKRKDGDGRVLAAEIMVNTDAVAYLIRQGKSYQIPSVIATSKEQGMQLMDNELMRLFKSDQISAEDAYMRATDKKDFEEFVGGEAKEKSLEEGLEHMDHAIEEDQTANAQHVARA